MPVLLTLRSPKSGRVLHEQTYDDGYRVDATGPFLMVVDRNGSVVAAHGTCPGLEARTVEYTAAAGANDGPEHYCPTCHQRVAVPIDETRPPSDGYLDDAETWEAGDFPYPVSDEALALMRLDRIVGNENSLSEVGTARVRGVVLQALRSWHARQREQQPGVVQYEDGSTTTGYVAASAAVAPAEVEFRKADSDGVTRPHPTSIAAPPELDLQQHPLALRVYAPGLVTFDGRVLRIEYDDGGYEATAPAPADVVPPTADLPPLPPVDGDPRRPRPGWYPEDAVTLTYAELRQLLALHVEAVADSIQSASGQARAMREGETPLRLAEVLDR